MISCQYSQKNGIEEKKNMVEEEKSHKIYILKTSFLFLERNLYFYSNCSQNRSPKFTWAEKLLFYILKMVSLSCSMLKYCHYYSTACGLNIFAHLDAFQCNFHGINLKLMNASGLSAHLKMIVKLLHSVAKPLTHRTLGFFNNIIFHFISKLAGNSNPPFSFSVRYITNFDSFRAITLNIFNNTPFYVIDYLISFHLTSPHLHYGLPIKPILTYLTYPLSHQNNILSIGIYFLYLFGMWCDRIELNINRGCLNNLLRNFILFHQ